MKRARVEGEGAGAGGFGGGFGGGGGSAVAFDVAAACAQFDEVWKTIPARHRLRFRDHAYKRIVESSEGAKTDADEDSDEDTSSEAVQALTAVAVHLRGAVPFSG